MKPFYKMALLAVGVLIGAGFIVGVVGTLLGGSRQLREAVIVRNSNIDIDDVNMVMQNIGQGITNATNIAREYSSETAGMSVLGDAEDIDKVEIDLNYAELTVQPANDGKWRMEQRSGELITCYTENETLYLIDRKKWVKNWKDDYKREIILYIPESVQLKEFKANIDAGEYEIYNIVADNLEIDLSAGNITGSGFQANNAELDVKAGNMDLTDVNFGETELSAGAGEIEISGTFQSDVKADCPMGTITIDVNGKLEDYNYELECSMGSISLGDLHYDGIGKELKIDNGKSVTMDLECSMGDITVMFSNE